MSKVWSLESGDWRLETGDCCPETIFTIQRFNNSTVKSKVWRLGTVDWRLETIFTIQQFNDSTFKFYDTGDFSLYHYFCCHCLRCVFGGEELANEGQGKLGMRRLQRLRPET